MTSVEPKHHYRELSDEEPSSARFKHATPIFRVAAMRTSIAYYVDQLGFQVAWDWGDPPTFACLKRGDVGLFLSEGSQGTSGTWLFVDVDDVDRLYAEYEARGAKVIQAPTNFAWGRREMVVQDPDGNRFRFASAPTGEPMGHRPPGECLSACAVF